MPVSPREHFPSHPLPSVRNVGFGHGIEEAHPCCVADTEVPNQAVDEDLLL